MICTAHLRSDTCSFGQSSCAAMQLISAWSYCVSTLHVTLIHNHKTHHVSHVVACLPVCAAACTAPVAQMVRLDEVPEAFSGIASVDRGESDGTSTQ